MRGRYVEKLGELRDKRSHMRLMAGCAMAMRLKWPH